MHHRLKIYMTALLFVLVSGAVILLPRPALAGNEAEGPRLSELKSSLLPGAQHHGSGRLTYLGWSVYDAALFSRARPFSFSKPFFLTLHYHMAAKGSQIAGLSLNGMRALGFRNEVRLAAWYGEMKRIFPNVKAGTRLTGLYLPGKGTRFYHGRRWIGTIHDPAFGRWFFRIWLGERSQLPELRQQLLGAR